MKPLLTRIAPTPSGYLHIGNAYSFVLTALVAHNQGASILLRIDDLDRDRYRSEYVEDIFRTLDFLGIEWQQGPQTIEGFEKKYSQLHRMDLYQQALETLWGKRRVFACTCSRKEISQHSRDGIYPGTCRLKKLAPDQPDIAWRIQTDQQPVGLKLMDGSTKRYHLHKELTDFVVKRKDGIPAYQVASLVDDEHFGVNRIGRGEDLFESTLAQLYLADTLGYTEFQKTRFLHHPLMKDKRGFKLSKSRASDSLLSSKLSSAEVYQLIARYMGISQRIHSFSDLLDFLEEINFNIDFQIG